MTIERQKTLDTIKSLVADKHVNVTPEHYEAWVSILDRLTPELLTATALEFQTEINSSLAALQTSHTAFFNPGGETIPLRHAFCATSRRYQTSVGERWVFQDVIEDGPADLAGIKPGELLIAREGTPVFAGKCQLFGLGRAYSVTVGNLSGEALRNVIVTVPNKPTKDRPPMVEPKALSFRFEDGVPILKVSAFPGAVGLSFVRELGIIIDRLTAERLDRLVIDLRGNIGGGLGSLRLMSYLCPDRRPIGYSLSKRHIQKGTVRELLPKISVLPESKLRQIGMFLLFRYIHKDRSLTLETEGLGPRPFHGRIVILINEHTHSAAEMVAAFAKEHHLATLVGTTTAGEVMGGANFNVGGGYRLRIPITTWQTWNGMQIENAGISPDVQIDFTPATASRERDSQLDTALKLVGA